ncbi:MAG: transposase, partial [Candidatus Helarchaeota archaeon]
TAKKQAFVGYRATLLVESTRMPILAYHVTPANCHDSSVFLPVLLSLEQHELLCQLNSFHGDHAYFTAGNLKWLAFHEKQREFHSSEESGKHPKKKRRAKRKARIRSKIEAVFGIMEENYHFGRTRVWGGEKVKSEMGLRGSAWNLFYLLFHVEGCFEDRISLRRLFHEK